MSARGTIPSTTSHRNRAALARIVAAAVAISGIGLVTATPASAAACTITWAGGGTGDWTTAANWSPTAVPGTSGRTDDEVCIPAGVTVLLDNGPSGTSGPFTVAGINTTPAAALSAGALTTKPSAPGALTVSGAGGVVSVLGALTLGSGGSVTVSAGALMTAASVSMPAGTLTVNGTLGVSGSFAMSSSVVGSGYLAGTSGTISVNGPLSINGGSVNGTGLQLTQTSGTTASISSSGSGPTSNPSIFGLSLTTASPLTISGQPYSGGSTFSTADQLTLAPGTQVQGGGALGARGVTVASGSASAAPRLVLSGSTSDLGGDLTSGGLAVADGATLTVPAGRTVTVRESNVPAVSAGTITGSGTLAIQNGADQSITGTLSVATLLMTGGQLKTQVGAAVTLGTATVTGGSWSLYGPVSVGSGGMTLGSTVTTQGALAGTGGSIALSGPWTQPGGRSDSATTVTITQGPGTTASFSGATSLKKALLYNTTFSTQSPVTVSGYVEGGGTSLTTTGALALAAGTQVTKAGPSPQTMTAGSVTTTTSGAALASTTLRITGSGSDLGADLSAAGLEVMAGGTLLVPAGRTITTTGGTALVSSGGVLGGSGTVAGHVQGAGTLAPGDTVSGPDVGTLSVTRYTQPSGAILDVDLSASASDAVLVTGSVAPSISGTVALTRLGGYVPPVGTTLAVVSAPSASGAPTVAVSATTTDDLSDGKFGPPTVNGTAVVVTRGPVTTTAPSAPGLALAAGIESIAATVSAPASDGGSPVTAYVLTCTPSCGTREITAAGTVALTGLTPGVAYTVSAVARNAVGDSSPTARVATPLAATATTANPAKLVLANSATAGAFTMTCRATSGPITSCGVVARSASGTVLAQGGPVSAPGGAVSISVTVRLTSAGLSASRAFGGVRAAITSTIGRASGGSLTTRSSIQLVRKTTRTTVLVGSLFTSGGTLTSSGKRTLARLATKAAGARALRCNGYWSKNVSSAKAYRLALDRASRSCTYVKRAIAARNLAAIATYSVRSYGSSRQVRGTATKNRRIVFVLTS